MILCVAAVDFLCHLMIEIGDLTTTIVIHGQIVNLFLIFLYLH